MLFKLPVYRNQKIYTIEKFNYLRSKLTRAAQLVMSGLLLSIENYDIVVSILKGRFKDIQSIINKHYVEVFNTQSATNDTPSLRKLNDDIERHMRSLEALHQEYVHFHDYYPKKPHYSLKYKKLPGKVDS